MTPEATRIADGHDLAVQFERIWGQGRAIVFPNELCCFCAEPRLDRTTDDGPPAQGNRTSSIRGTSRDLEALATDGTGAYRASAEIAPPLPAPLTSFTSMRTTVWKVYTGALINTDGQSASGAPVDDYLIHFDAGQERIIALDAPNFDTVVQVRAVDGRDGEDTLASNDDGGNSLNSLLRFKAETAGDYIVRVTALGANGRGSYTLRVSE